MGCCATLNIFRIMTVIRNDTMMISLSTLDYFILIHFNTRMTSRIFSTKLIRLYFCFENFFIDYYYCNHSMHAFLFLKKKTKNIKKKMYIYEIFSTLFIYSLGWCSENYFNIFWRFLFISSMFQKYTEFARSKKYYIYIFFPLL